MIVEIFCSSPHSPAGLELELELCLRKGHGQGCPPLHLGLKIFQNGEKIFQTLLTFPTTGTEVLLNGAKKSNHLSLSGESPAGNIDMKVECGADS